MRKKGVLALKWANYRLSGGKVAGSMRCLFIKTPATRKGCGDEGQNRFLQKKEGGKVSKNNRKRRG